MSVQLFRGDQSAEICVNCEFIYDAFYCSIQPTAIREVGWSNQIDTAVSEHCLTPLPCSLVPRLEDRNGMSSLVLHEAKAGDIGLSVPDVNDVLKRNRSFAFRDPSVYRLMIKYV